MKILSMMAECRNDVSWSHTHHFEQALARHADVRWAGHGHKQHVKNENLNDTVNRVMPDADWVILYDRAQLRFKEAVKVPDKRVCRVAYVTTDIQWNPPLHTGRFNKGNWDAFLMLVAKTPQGIFKTDGGRAIRPVDPEYYLKHLNAPIFYLAPNVNPDVFKPSSESSKYDVVFLGDHNATYYPLRNDIWHGLPKLAKDNNWRTLMKETPPGRSLVSRNIDELLRKGYVVGLKYAEALARSRAFIFGSSRFKYAGKKFVEGMACGTLCLSDTPLMAEELHYVPDWNFAEVDRGNWKDKLKYYLKHEEERREIALNGYTTVMKYHTADVRARQLLGFLEEHS